MSSAREQAEAREQINPVLAGILARDPEAFRQAVAQRQAEDEARLAPAREYDAQQRALRDAVKAEADATAAAAAVPPTVAQQIEEGVRNALGLARKVATPAETTASIARKSNALLTAGAVDPSLGFAIGGQA